MADIMADIMEDIMADTDIDSISFILFFHIFCTLFQYYIKCKRPIKPSLLVCNARVWENKLKASNKEAQKRQRPNLEKAA